MRIDLRDPVTAMASSVVAANAAWLGWLTCALAVAEYTWGWPPPGPSAVDREGVWTNTSSQTSETNADSDTETRKSK